MSTVNELVEELLTTRAQLAELTIKEKELREQLRQELVQENRQAAVIQSSTGAVKLRRQSLVKITYDESLLLERLGADRFRDLAAIDRVKLRGQWDNLPTWLGDHFLEVASLDRKRIKEAVESGAVAGQLFAGAFSKESHEILTVTHIAAEQDQGNDSR